MAEEPQEQEVTAAAEAEQPDEGSTKDMGMTTPKNESDNISLVLDEVSNVAADPRNMRRIIAEDPDWSLAIVPDLSELNLRHIIENFANNSHLLNKLLPKHQAIVLSRISTSLPIQITAPLINDEGYWERCCRDIWEVCDVAAHGGSWKRLYFERYLQGLIEIFVPDTTDPTELMETLQLGADVVKKLDIRQLLPPVRVEADGLLLDDDSDSDSDNDEMLSDHFDFAPVLAVLPLLEELHVTYGVRDCGMNFEWEFFLFKSTDCLKLAKCLSTCHSLRIFKLHCSKVDDDKVRVLIAHILDHPGLEKLDLSCNIIGDKGARAVGRLLKGTSPLVSLNLMDNNIRGHGAMAIAHALISNSTLKFLNLRHNHLSDEGGQAISRALMKNGTLIELNMSSNELGEPTATLLSQALMANNTLKTIDLSCNRLGHDGGKHLRDGLAENGSLTAMDLRLTDCGQEAEYNINLFLHRNREAERSAAVKEREVTLPPQSKDALPQFAHRFELPEDIVY